MVSLVIWSNPRNSVIKNRTQQHFKNCVELPINRTLKGESQRNKKVRQNRAL